MKFLQMLLLFAILVPVSCTRKSEPAAEDTNSENQIVRPDGTTAETNATTATTNEASGVTSGESVESNRGAAVPAPNQAPVPVNPPAGTDTAVNCPEGYIKAPATKNVESAAGDRNEQDPYPGCVSAKDYSRVDDADNESDGM